MRNSLLIFLVGLFLLSLAPTSFAGMTDTRPGEPGIVSDPGPLRDWGEDWIFYDGDGNWVYFTFANPGLWGRVTFTPNSEFRLEGVRLRTYNPNGVDNPEVEIRVYSEDRGNLDEMLFGMSDDNIPDDLWNYEIPEEEWDEGQLTFDGGEAFSILVGPALAANGWYITGDNGGNGHSFLYIENDGNPDGEPLALENNDLIIRANGSYLEAFWDMGVVAVYNTEGYDDAGNWIQLQGGSTTFKADIANFGNDLEEDEYIINFTVVGPDGEPVFENDMLGPALELGDTISVESNEAWEIPADAEVGTYQVWVTTVVEGDANGGNDVIGLDQIVFLSAPEGDDDPNASDVWIGYMPADGDEAMTVSNLNEAPGEGRGINLHHPGGDMAIRATAVRVAVHNAVAGGQNPGMKIGLINRAANTFEYILELEGETNDEQEFGAEGAEYDWVVFDLTQEEDTVAMNAGDAIVGMYFTDSTSVMLNSTRPVAGGASEMPWCMATASGNSLFASGLGDFAVQFQLEWSNIARNGRFVSPDPERGATVDFGNDLEWDMDYTTDVVLRSTGTDTVTCRNILISGGIRDQLTATLDNGEDANQTIMIAPEESVTITITWHTPMEVAELDEAIRFVTNADELPQFNINFVGGTFTSVSENDRPGIPEQYSMDQNYPNPFNPTTSVDFAMVNSGNVHFGIYDMSGRLVKEVYNGELSSGYHSMEINASDLTAGVYFYSLKTVDFSSTRKMVLLK